MKKPTFFFCCCFIWLLVFAVYAQAMPIVWDVGAAGAPAFGDANTLTGTFDQIGTYSQTSTVQEDTDGNGTLSVGDQFTDSGDLWVRHLLAAAIIDYEGLNQPGGYEVTARWSNLAGYVTGIALDPVTGDTRIDVRYTSGTVNMYLDPALDRIFANPGATTPPSGAGGSGFDNGTLIATLDLKEGVGNTYVDFGGGDLSNRGVVEFLLEFTYALAGFWYDASGTVPLDPVGTKMTALVDMNIDTPIQVPSGVAGTLYTAYSNQDGSILVQGSPCVDIEKQVSVDGLPLVVAGPTGMQWNPDKVWFDADVWADAPTTGMAATYRLIVENCGAIELTNVTLNDIAPTSTIPEKIVFEDVNIGTLQPGEIRVLAAGWSGTATTGPVTAVSGFAGLDAPARCQDSWVSVDGSPEGMYLNTAEVTTDQLVNDENPAWVSCRMEEPGACRMTGGSVTVNDFLDADGDAMVFYSYVDGTSTDATQTIGKGKNATGTWVTTGGQIGAPSTDPATGHWEHTQHAGAVGNFTFLAGTASAPPGTEISHIDCADPGWCVQARCAPFKQIFWDGIGYFPNKHGGEDFNASFPAATCTVTPGGPSRDGTLHYFRAMVGDFGENDRRNRQISADNCEWLTTAGGPSGFDVSEVVELDATTNTQFGDKGGQDCDKCPDYYQIEIYCGSSEAAKGEVIYTFADFIDGGNFQIHPETSEQCTADLFAPVTSTKGGKK